MEFSENLKVLKYSGKLLKFIGIQSHRPIHSSTSRIEFLKSFKTFVTLSGVLYSLSWTALVYVYQNPSDIAGSINAFIQTTGGWAMGFSFISAAFNSIQINQLQSELQALVDDGS